MSSSINWWDRFMSSLHSVRLPAYGRQASRMTARETFQITLFPYPKQQSKIIMNIEKWENIKMGKFTLRFRSYTLTMRHVFTVASFSRTTTPVVLTELEYDGIIGFGEASMPPYLGETQESVTSFLRKIDLSTFSSPFETAEILHYVDTIDTKNTA
ncbi:MAG TPA: hypothetical protein PKA53_10485, partial [Sphingobacterium sp.]|nr:hypothetical protein [Sphingobacterium sp.]